jgi:ferrous iron transport protein B
LYYPQRPEAVEAALAERRAEITTSLESAEMSDDHREALQQELAAYETPEGRDKLAQGEAQRQSYLGRMGRLVEPAVRPLGWDWRVGCAVIASFPAREVVLGTLGVIYNLGDVDFEEAAGETELQSQLRRATWDGTDTPVFNIPVALSLMVFFALCAQCAATLAVIKRETNSWRWPLFTFAYMTGLAYVAALVTYQVGMLIG